MPVDRTDEEELYFAELDQERRRKLREKLEGNAADLEEKQKIASSMGTEDLSVAEKVKALGFSDDSARVFHLVPLIHVAWADGKIHRNERIAIFKILEQLGIDKESEAWTTVASLLEQRPPESWMRQSVEVLRELTGGLSDRAQEIVDQCISVAAASGGFLGIGGKIDAEEKALIEDIVQGLAKT
jgi:tellurite resistance protein